MCFRSIQRELANETGIELAQLSRNPYVFQVNSKQLLLNSAPMKPDSES